MSFSLLLAIDPSVGLVIIFDFILSPRSKIHTENGPIFKD